MRRAACVLLCVASALSGCWRNPDPNRYTGEADNYDWSATLADVGTGYYRLALTPDLRRRLDNNQHFAVFDARGVAQECGELGFSDSPLSSVVSEYAAQVSPFDPQACPALPSPCFAGHACDAPAGCPHLDTDFGGTTLADVDSVAALLKAARDPLPIPTCHPANPEAVRECTPADATMRAAAQNAYLRRIEAFEALASLGIDPDRPPPPPTKKAIVEQHRYAIRTEQQRADTRIAGLRLHWSRPPNGAPRRFRLSTPVLQGSDGGEIFTVRGDDVGDGSLWQTLPANCGMTTDCRVELEDSARDIHLLEARVRTYRVKEFVTSGMLWLWLRAAGQPPYTLRSGKWNHCQGSPNAADLPPYEEISAPDWPPIVSVGTFASVRRDVMRDFFRSAWWPWTRYLLLAWSICLGAVLLRWLLRR